MKTLLAVGLLVGSFWSALPQNPSLPVVTWNPNDPGCKVLYLDGKPHEHLEANGLVFEVFTPRRHDKHFNEILISVFNASPSETDVNPSQWRAIANDATGTELRYVDGDAVLGKEERHERRMQAIGNGLAGFGAGMQNQTATVNNSDGSTSTVTYHDPSSTAQVNENSARRSAQTSQYFANASAAVLRRNTLPGGGFVVGWVYFSRPKNLDKKAGVRFVDVEANGALYRFPF